jgi:hypothetical protein
MRISHDRDAVYIRLTEEALGTSDPVSTAGSCSSGKTQASSGRILDASACLHSLHGRPWLGAMTVLSRTDHHALH